MTDCTSQPIAFPTLKRRRIEAEFTGGAITSNVGAQYGKVRVPRFGDRQQ